MKVGKNTLSEGLENLKNQLKQSKKKVKVGIIGKNNRTDGQTNAEVGAKHEFGFGRIPQRSFLRMSIMKHEKELKKTFGESIKKGSDVGKVDFDLAFERLGIDAEAKVIKAFDTGGYGEWEKLAPETIARKKVAGNDKILVDTAQLKGSITSKVE